MLNKMFALVVVLAGFLAVAVPVVILKSLFAMWAWNYAVPALFGAPPITLWQAFALCTLVYVALGNPSVAANKRGA